MKTPHPYLPAWQDFALTGDLGRRVECAVARLLALRPRLFTEGKIIAGYGYAEIAGNWLETMELVILHAGGRHDWLLREVADELLRYQQPYGGFCPVSAPSTRTSHWVGDQRALSGLLAAHRALSDSRYLDAAQRVARYAMENWPREFDALAVNSWGARLLNPASYFCLAPHAFADLYEATGTTGYLEFARRICLCMPRLHPAVETEHADGRMLLLRGLLQIYRITGEEALFKAVRDDQQVIAEHFMWPSGGMPELLPDNRRDEACQTANWARLNLELWELTDQPGYLDLAERTWLNHLYFDQHPTGGFCWGRTLRRGGGLSQRMSESGEPFEMWYCCSLTAPRALLDIGRHAVSMRDGNPAIALWVGGTYRLPGCRVEIVRDIAPGQPLEATFESESPVSCTMRLPARVELRRLSVNGEETPLAGANGWLTLPPLRRAHLRLDVRCHEEREEHRYAQAKTLGDVNNPDATWDAVAALNYTGAHTAMFSGPWMLKADDNETDWFETNRHMKTNLEDKTA